MCLRAPKGTITENTVEKRWNFGRGIVACAQCGTFPIKNRGCGDCSLRLCKPCFLDHVHTCTHRSANTPRKLQLLTALVGQSQWPCPAEKGCSRSVSLLAENTLDQATQPSSLTENSDFAVLGLREVVKNMFSSMDEAFCRLGGEDDGIIEYSEFADFFCQELGNDCYDYARKLFDQIDVDADAKITRSEFRVFYYQDLEKPKPDLALLGLRRILRNTFGVFRAAFDELTACSGGSIDRESFQRFVERSTSDSGNASYANHLFDLIDKDGDMTISESEFKAFWTQSQSGKIPVITWISESVESDFFPEVARADTFSEIIMGLTQSLRSNSHEGLPLDSWPLVPMDSAYDGASKKVYIDLTGLRN